MERKHHNDHDSYAVSTKFIRKQTPWFGARPGHSSLAVSLERCLQELFEEMRDDLLKKGHVVLL